MDKLVFTPDQVEHLTAFQTRNDFHPFTCANRNDGNHRGDGILVPTVRGWICQYCDYKQDWAHEFMYSNPGGLTETDW